MATAMHVELADALERASKAAPEGVVRSARLRRGDRELLLRSGYLKGIIKGWYYLVRAGSAAGESTAWYATFWQFLAAYLAERFGGDYCLSAADSIRLHTGATVVPRQVIVLTARGGVTQLELPQTTSLLVYQDPKNLPPDVETKSGLRVMPLALALGRAPESFFQAQPTEAELALRTLPDFGALVRVITEARSPSLAGRFAGAYSFLGDQAKARAIEAAARALGIAFKPDNPFRRPAPLLQSVTRVRSPYAGRVEALFQAMRADVIKVFATTKPKAIRSVEACLHRVDDVYQNDAYHSLSIEGYQVSLELIRRIRDGKWNPDRHGQDREARDVFAAKGYLESFHLVKEAIRDILNGAEAAVTARDRCGDWYGALFAESVKAGLMESHRLAGYRNGPVYIRGSRHVPPPANAVHDAMEALFDCLQSETSAVVRAVLGHSLYGFIHPYFDGNGRTARFLMNVFLTTGGYPWTIVRVSRRADYMTALEAASTRGDIVPFAKFILEEMQVDWSKEPSARKTAR